jgi:polysaccharide export outer membrane protein
MSRRLATLTAALLLVLVLGLGGCAQDDLGLGGLFAADVIYDAPPPAPPSPDQPIPIASLKDWGQTTVYPDGPPVSPHPVPWGAAVVVAAPPAAYGAPGAHDPYILDTGDKLRVFVYGQPNLSRIYTVDQVGNIAFPLVGAIRARGRTTTELERTIRARLARDFVRDPFVTVDVALNRPFFILGEVRLPGQYPFVSGMTVETAVAIAGGYTERASERRFRITRRMGPLVDQIEAPSDYTLLPGDTVYVFERFL